MFEYISCFKFMYYRDDTVSQQHVNCVLSISSMENDEFGVFGKVIHGMRDTSSQLKSSCTDLATLSNDIKSLSHEFHAYLKRARKEEKKLSDEVSTLKKNYEKALKKEQTQKSAKQELENMLTMNEKPLSNQEKDKIERKLKDLEPTLDKLESENRLLLLKFQEKEEVYKSGLGNILSHLEYIDRKRYSTLKELTRRFLEIIKTIGSCLSENAIQVSTSIQHLEDEKVFANFVTSCRNEVFIPAAAVKTSSEQSTTDNDQMRNLDVEDSKVHETQE